MATGQDIFDAVESEAAPGGVAVAETPTQEAPAPQAETPAPEPERGSVDRPRGPDGKFIRADSDPPPPPPPNAPPATAPQTTEQPEPETAAPDEEVQPFSLRAMDRDITIPGALYKPGHGVFIPDTPESRVAFDQMLARGAKYAEVQQQNQQLRTALKQGTTADRLEKEALSEVLKTMMDPAWIQAASANPELEFERIALRLERAQLQLKESRGGELVDVAALTDQSDRDQLAEALESELEATYNDLLRELAPALPAKDREALRALIETTGGAYIGTRAGQYGVEVKRMRHAMESWLAGRAPSRGSTAPPPAVTAAKRNAAATQPQVSVPATPGGAARNLAASPPAATAKREDRFTSKRDVNKYFGI